MAGWGNAARGGELARLKRHRREMQTAHERIRELEAENARLAKLAERAYHPTHCEHWRGGDCTCLGDTLARVDEAG